MTVDMRTMADYSFFQYLSITPIQGKFKIPEPRITNVSFCHIEKLNRPNKVCFDMSHKWNKSGNELAGPEKLGSSTFVRVATNCRKMVTSFQFLEAAPDHSDQGKTQNS
jgi:hypothetical protein